MSDSNNTHNMNLILIGSSASFSADIEKYIKYKHKLNQLGSSHCLEIKEIFNKCSHTHLSKTEYENLYMMINKFCPDTYGFRASER
jgi:hypothetical protein